jgi:hypothetical protein
MTYANPVYSNAEQTLIVAEKLGGGSKLIEQNQTELWAQFQSGAYGPISPYVPPVADPAAELEAERDAMIVSAFQAKAALSLQGYFEAAQVVVAAVEAAEGPSSLIVLAWHNAIEYRRRSPSIQIFQEALSLTDAQVDDLFRLAATIDV